VGLTLAFEPLHELARSTGFFAIAGWLRRIPAADLGNIALFVRRLPVFVGLAGFERHRFITDRTAGLPLLFMPEDSIYGGHLGLLCIHKR
jgi:hypothetical protein